jgi:hypothetical protein
MVDLLFPQPDNSQRMMTPSDPQSIVAMQRKAFDSKRYLNRRPLVVEQDEDF